jgi:hypothetical protein
MEQLILDFDINIEMLIDNIIDELENPDSVLSEANMQDNLNNCLEKLEICVCNPNISNRLRIGVKNLINIESKIQYKRSIMESLREKTRIKTKKLCDNNWYTVKLLELIQEYNSNHAN